MDIKESMKLYSEAGEMMGKGMIEEAFDLYCDAFLCRMGEIGRECEFSLFYRLQMAKYFSCKKNVFLSLAEGDMVSDLIKGCYNQFVSTLKESPFCRTSLGRLRLLENLEIIFPVQNDTEDCPSKIAVSK